MMMVVVVALVMVFAMGSRGGNLEVRRWLEAGGKFCVDL